MSKKKRKPRLGQCEVWQKEAERLNWEGFEVGNSNDFAEEVERTGKNTKPMTFLAARRKSAKTAAIPLAEVRKQLGLD